MVKSNLKLSDNFTLREFTKSQYAIRHGIDNTPLSSHIDNMIYLCKHGLQPLRDWLKTQVIISSGYRNNLVNKSIGGSPTSLHRFGCAADIDDGKYSLMQVLEFIHYNLPYTELIAEYFPYGWVHYGLCRKRGDVKALKLKDANHNYELVTIDYIKKLYG